MLDQEQNNKLVRLTLYVTDDQYKELQEALPKTKYKSIEDLIRHFVDTGTWILNDEGSLYVP